MVAPLELFHRNGCTALISSLLLFLLALTAPALADDPLPVATDAPASLALGVGTSGTVVFWHATCGTDFSPPSSYVRTLDLAVPDAVAHTVYAPPACDVRRVVSENVASDGTALYWLTADGFVRRVPLDGGAVGIAAYSGGSEITQGSIDVGTSDVFWTDGSHVFRAPKGGGGAAGQSIYTGSTLHDVKVAADQSVYVRSGARLVHLAIVDSTYVPVHVADAVGAYALDGNVVFYSVGAAIYSRNNGSDPVRFVALAGGGNIDGLAVSASDVYIHLRPPLANGALYRVSRAIPTPRQMTINSSFTAQLSLSGSNLFWLEPNAGIFEIATGSSGGVSPALQSASITGIEVTQGIQVTGNLVPLIGDKMTAVRVYVQGIPDGSGPWTGVRATLTVSGSAHSHTAGPMTLPATGSNRLQLADSFTFYLAPDETQAGLSRTLTATLLLPVGRPQRSTAGNTLATTATFGPARNMTIYGYTYANSNASTTYTDSSRTTTCLASGSAPDHVFRPFSDMETARQFVETTYPVSHLTIVPLAGSGTVEYDDAPIDPGNGLAYCGAFLRAHIALPAIIASVPGTDRGYLMTPEFGGNGWCCNMSTGSNVHRIARGQDESFGGGGNDGGTMAQEIGHSFGGVLSIHTWDVGNQYPRSAVGNIPGVDSDGPIGPVVGLRMYPTIQPVPGMSSSGANAAWEYMSYHNAPHWTSPFVFCKLLDYMTGGAQLCPSTVEGGGTASSGIRRRARFPQALALDQSVQRDAVAPPGSVLLIQGVAFAGERFFIARTEVLPYTLGHVQSQDANGPYWVRLLDAQGRALETSRFNVVRRMPHPKQLEADLFAVSLPWSAAARAVVVVGPNDSVLSKRTFSTAKPSLVLNSGVPAMLKGPVRINWSSTRDAATDTSYAVEYSADGSRWIRIANDLALTNYTLDPLTLPASVHAGLRIIASTGVLTSTVVTRRFIVAPHSPVVSIHGADKAVTADTDTILGGSAWDADEGAIDDPKRYAWRDGKTILGTGLWIVPRLSPGTHTIILTVSGNNGLEGHQTATIIAH